MRILAKPILDELMKKEGFKLNRKFYDDILGEIGEIEG